MFLNFSLLIRRYDHVDGSIFLSSFSRTNGSRLPFSKLNIISGPIISKIANFHDTAVPQCKEKLM